MSVTTPHGFRAAGVTAGLKPSGKPDLALVVNDGPSHNAAAVYTGNRCKANPVLWSEQVSADGIVHAVVLNSGGANCYTGQAGFQTTHRTAEAVAEELGISASDVVVCSTGLIGAPLPEDKLLPGVATAAGRLSADGGDDAAGAIITTDTHAKTVELAGEGYSVGGMAKGAGMLAPGLATMLVVLTTDADVDAATLDGALRTACAQTFDRLDTDGCMSTNDTVVLMASGASGITPDAADLTALVTEACAQLTAQLHTDAEGAHHDIAITTRGAATETDAVTASRAVARSNLFKAAVFGNDPNWGRVLAAIGTTDAAFTPAEVDVAVNDVWVCKAGTPHADPATVDLTPRAVSVTIDLHAGSSDATIWTSDLTHDYVEENSAYST
ncbi:bifunctional glutamate N-acetyltransferase/amino-acid acetyltransferase ArgJ [Spelaeicoccus albus]|uniref:Arginine biosynthesis bifunctional protein ArgJ n=1 Tax=Spelaeicoccus albus TaxID=1280376 RepID=A0A7Z0D5A4_9MICO|nr:bifunctional glutamate N-acetyltransferase/amino-acid acetyltransferase ArgJ [Spelaeicoccus albus]NYI69147.1 glutamate N-acetyltransferase/amino-acid N-acetyltransferase [Spelaeicoccus albus]